MNEEFIKGLVVASFFWFVLEVIYHFIRGSILPDSLTAQNFENNRDFNKAILDAINFTNKVEIDALRLSEPMDKNKWFGLLREYTDRAEKRWEIYDKLSNLKRKEINPLTDEEYNFLITPHCDVWQEVIE